VRCCSRLQPVPIHARQRTQAAVAKCKTGDTSGIPGIEKALKDAKFDLPPRG
jgi:hypothetical protein